MSTYDKIVSENLAHMGTPHSQWRAVPIKGMAETTDGTGNTVSMPEFDFPKDYSDAPSLYKNSGTTVDMCCELCAHPIKRAYWVQNDAKRWTMLVGSECVTHFEGASGQQLAKEAVWENNRQLMRDAIAMKRKLQKDYCTESTRYTYRGAMPVWNWHNKQAQSDFSRLIEITKNRQPDPSQWHNYPPDSNGVVTRWANKYGDEVREMIDRWEEK